MNVFRNIALSFLCFTSVSALGQDMVGVSDEKITDIRVSPWNTDTFAIKTTIHAPADMCEGLWVVFDKASFAGHVDAYERAYSMALTAMSAEMPIMVMLGSADCASAKTIGFIN